MTQVKAVEYGKCPAFTFWASKRWTPYGRNDERRLDGTIDPDVRRRKGIFPGTKRPGVPTSRTDAAVALQFPQVVIRPVQ
jgi:hypothetical protein